MDQPYELDKTEDLALVNTTKRWDKYCTAVSKEGQRCSLYSPHTGGHLPKHGIETDRFED